MFTLETERRVPGPETRGAAKLSSQDPVPGILRGKVAALPPLDDPLTEKEKENLILPISSLFTIYISTRCLLVNTNIRSSRQLPSVSRVQN